MGLDQYALSKTAEDNGEGTAPSFFWRKHPKLQAFMEMLFEKRTGLASSDLNCGELELEPEDIDTLEQAVSTNSLPVCTVGFFYGLCAQEQSAIHYRDYDLEFCAWARAQIGQGAKVLYSCWW